MSHFILLLYSTLFHVIVIYNLQRHLSAFERHAELSASELYKVHWQ